MEASRNEVFLRLARSVAQLVSFAITLNIHTEFTHIVKREAQPCVGQCEIWVEFDGLLIKRNRRSIPGGSMNLKTQTKGFQGFKRRRCGLLKWSIEFLHRAQRLAQLASNFHCCLPQSVKHVILVAGLSFRARQRFAAGAVDRLERQKVLRANLRNRTVEDGGARCPLAEFPRNRWRKFCFGGLAHQAERLLDLLLRDNAQKG